MSRYTHQELAFIRESTYATSPISTASTEIWKLFKYNTPFGDFPTEQRDLIQHYTGAATTPQENYFSSHEASGTVAGTAINMILLQMAMTKVANVTNNDNTPSAGIHEHKWTTRPVGESLDSFVARTEDGNSSNKIYEELLGMYIHNLTMAMDFSQQSNMMTKQLNILGQQIDASPTVNTDSTNIVYPGNSSDHYMLDTNFEMIWGGTAATDGDGFDFYSTGGTDISDVVLNYAFIVNNNMRPDKPADQDYPNDYIFGVQNPIISFDLLRHGTKSKQVYDDFQTMQDNATTKPLHIKQYQTANHFVELWIEDITLGRAGRNHTKGTKQTPVFRFNGLLKDVNVKVHDGLAGGTYYA